LIRSVYMFWFDSALLITEIIREVLVDVDSAAWTWFSFTDKEMLNVECSELVVPADDAGRFIWHEGGLEKGVN
jgi:hypothetical protein